MHDGRYVHVRERAEAYAAWYEKERVSAHITEKLPAGGGTNSVAGRQADGAYIFI